MRHLVSCPRRASGRNSWMQPASHSPPRSHGEAMPSSQDRRDACHRRHGGRANRLVTHWRAVNDRIILVSRSANRNVSAFLRAERAAAPYGNWGWTVRRNWLVISRARRMRLGIAEMTYCCGILVRDGLVMIADTRTNAGLDNVSTFRKLHVFTKPGERIMAVASAGNLAISQSVLSTLTEGLEDPTTGEVETLMNAPTMFQAAQRIGRAIRAGAYHRRTGAEIRRRLASTSPSCSAARSRARGCGCSWSTPPAISSNAPPTRLICRSASTNTASRCSTAPCITTSSSTTR